MTATAPARPLTARPCAGLSGRAAVPGDKSISHRALMLGALAVGETTIEGLLLGEDVLATAAAMQALGATVERPANGPGDRAGPAGPWRVRGRGVGALSAPDDVLDLIERAPEGLELVLTGGHERPDYLDDHADLVTRVAKEKHPLDAGQGARKGTEF